MDDESLLFHLVEQSRLFPLVGRLTSFVDDVRVTDGEHLGNGGHVCVTFRTVLGARVDQLRVIRTPGLERLTAG